MRRFGLDQGNDAWACRGLLFALLLAAAPAMFLAQACRIRRMVRAAASASAPRSPSEEPATTFKVNVRLVNVFTTVTDESGAPVGDLTKNDFHVFEDGEEQEIAVFDRESGLPLSVVLAVDASLSTRKDLPLELESARRFAHAILRPVDAISIYQFSQYVTEVIPFTGDLRVVDRGIARIRCAIFDRALRRDLPGVEGADPRAREKGAGRHHRWRRHQQPDFL